MVAAHKDTKSQGEQGALWGRDEARLPRLRCRNPLTGIIFAVVAFALTSTACGSFLTDAERDVDSRPLPFHDDQDSGLELEWRPTTLEHPTFRVSNSYTEKDLIVWSPWKHLAEPYKMAHFSAMAADDLIKDNGQQPTFLWTIGDEATYEGRVVNHIFEKVGKVKVTLSQIIPSTGQLVSHSEYVMVKYVRREIRTLTDHDREAFLDAMETLYRLPTRIGVDIYGPLYKGIDFFIQMHLNGAGTVECDHWHDDAGIMTHHVGYTLMFEQSLQLVDPSVSIPYWEYTLDDQLYEKLNNSPVFQESWLGVMSPQNSQKIVDTGRWAYTPIMENAWDFVHNPYGLLVSPWNTTPVPFLTRHDSTNGLVQFGAVSCAMLQICFKRVSMAIMNECLNGLTHGPIHILIGGEWNHPDLSFVYNTGVGSLIPLLAKVLWRRGWLRVPDDCTGMAPSECVTTCPAEIYGSKGMSAYDVLKDAKVLHWIRTFSYDTVMYDEDTGEYYLANKYDKDFIESFWQRMLDAICNTGYVGAMYTSAAPQDPSFWVIHPSAERLLNLRRILGRENSDYNFDEAWGYYHSDDVGDLRMVCRWEENRENDWTYMPQCRAGSCPGHMENDLLPFSFNIGDKTDVKFTNAEFIDFIFPTTEDLPYMYDNFEWEHCNKAGFPLGP